jgi:nitrogen regulatory protein P-II 1
MDRALVVAIIRRTALEAAENKLQQIGVRGFTVIAVRGRGEVFAPGHDFLAHDPLDDEVKIEVYVAREQARQVLEAIVDAAHTGSEGDGIVAILPVESVVSVRTRAEATSG